jgi:hypothetical protein
VNEFELLPYVSVLSMLQCGPKPDHPEVVYSVANTEDNAKSILDHVAVLAGVPRQRPHPIVSMSPSRPVIPVWVPSGDTSNGYPGYADWSDRLMQLGVRLIQPVEVPGNVNTKSEMLALAEQLQRTGVQEVVLVAAPFHVLRVCLTLLAALGHYGLERTVRVYVVPGEVKDHDRWWRPSLHSQGKLTGSWLDFVVTEFERIKLYTAQGDLVTFDQAIEYLRWRDGQTK